MMCEQWRRSDQKANQHNYVRDSPIHHYHASIYSAETLRPVQCYRFAGDAQILVVSHNSGRF
jgi:heme-degrading monooxygenase HmoA